MTLKLGGFEDGFESDIKLIPLAHYFLPLANFSLFGKS